MKSELLAILKQQLIVSCQAPSSSPLHQPEIITAIAATAIQQGAAAVRLDTPSHIQAFKTRFPNIPVLGLWKCQYTNSEIYITPTVKEVVAIREAGAEIIAFDATLRPHPQEPVQAIISQIHKIGGLAMADIDTEDSAIAAAEAGADLIATTLYGYTPSTADLEPPGYELIKTLSQSLDLPIIAEGGIATPQMAREALDLGAYAVVVGTAITGIDQKVQEFKKVLAG